MSSDAKTATAPPATTDARFRFILAGRAFANHLGAEALDIRALEQAKEAYEQYLTRQDAVAVATRAQQTTNLAVLRMRISSWNRVTRNLTTDNLEKRRGIDYDEYKATHEVQRRELEDYFHSVGRKPGTNELLPVVASAVHDTVAAASSCKQGGSDLKGDYDRLRDRVEARPAQRVIEFECWIHQCASEGLFHLEVLRLLQSKARADVDRLRDVVVERCDAVEQRILQDKLKSKAKAKVTVIAGVPIDAELEKRVEELRALKEAAAAVATANTDSKHSTTKTL